MKKKVRKKPVPPSRKLSKRPPEPKVGEAAGGINEVSPITAKQITRAERAIDNLREEVQSLRKAPPPVKVVTDQPKVTVELPQRPRIVKVSIKYDQLGMPAELIPQYGELTV